MVILAALLTVVILLAYGGYTAWNAWFGSDDTTTGEASVASAYEDAVGQSIFRAFGTVQAGVDVHLLADLEGFVDVANGAIAHVQAQRAVLEGLTPTPTGEQADVVSSSIQGLDQLNAALIRWRDAVFNVRLAMVDDAHAEVDAAITRLAADLDRWKSLPAPAR